MAQVDVTFVDARTVVVQPSGRLDEDTGRELLRAVATAVSNRVPRLLVDLGAIRSYTEEAIVAVTGCRRLAQRYPERVTVMARGGSGALALVRSCVTVP